MQAADDGCAADLTSCRFDSICNGEKKCCRNEKCGYNSCMDPVREGLISKWFGLFNSSRSDFAINI